MTNSNNLPVKPLLRILARLVQQQRKLRRRQKRLMRRVERLEKRSQGQSSAQ